MILEYCFPGASKTWVRKELVWHTQVEVPRTLWMD